MGLQRETDSHQFPNQILDALAEAGPRTVLEDGARTLSGAELHELVARAAAGLRAAGIGPGAGVAFTVGVSPEVLATLLAAYTVGARVLGVRRNLPNAYAAYLLGLDNAALVSDDPAALDPDLTRIVPRTLSVTDLCATAPDPGEPRAAGRAADVARLIHTSGSTGTPKPVAQTYAAVNAEWAWNPAGWGPAAAALSSRFQRLAVFGPLTAQVGFQYVAMTLITGGTVVLADLNDPAGLNGALARLGATATSFTVPQLTRLLAEQRDDPAELSSLRAVLAGGSPLPPGRHREALDVLGPVVFHGYGQTEVGLIAMGTPEDPPGTVGVPMDGVEIEIRDAHGVPLPPGVDGEIFVRKPSQATGYWDDPRLTAEVFVDGGWIRTRDLGQQGHDGRVRVTGRARDIIFVSGTTHYLGPIERVLAEHPDVVEAYVLAVPDEHTGEAAHAFVVPAGGDNPDPAALRALVATRLGTQCAPKRITTITEAPVAPSGKPDKRLLLGG